MKCKWDAEIIFKNPINAETLCVTKSIFSNLSFRRIYVLLILWSEVDVFKYRLDDALQSGSD